MNILIRLYLVHQSNIFLVLESALKNNEYQKEFEQKCFNTLFGIRCQPIYCIVFYFTKLYGALDNIMIKAEEFICQNYLKTLFKNIQK